MARNGEEWLNDRLIHAAFILMKGDKNLLPVDGLQDSILGKTLSSEVSGSEIVQILHSENSHWVTIWVLHDWCNSLWMSIYNFLNVEANHHVLLWPNCNLWWAKARRANVWCKKNEAASTFYSALKMEWWGSYHAKERKCLRKMKRREAVRVYCRCRLQEGGAMILCDTCGEWFHDTCVNVPCKAWATSDYKWQCCNCNWMLLHFYMLSVPHVLFCASVTFFTLIFLHFPLWLPCLFFCATTLHLKKCFLQVWYINFWPLNTFNIQSADFFKCFSLSYFDSV